MHKDVAYVGEYACVGSRVGAWCSSDRALVYLYDLVNELDSLDRGVRQRLFERAVELLAENRLRMLLPIVDIEKRVALPSRELQQSDTVIIQRGLCGTVRQEKLSARRIDFSRLNERSFSMTAS